jgi:hypothetical protein
VSAVLLAVAVAAGCAPRSRDLHSGHYRAVVELPGGKVPFGLDVARDKEGVALYLVNGKERVRVPEATAVTGRLSAHLPGTGNVLAASITGDELEGEVTLAGTGHGKLVLPFSAARGRNWRFIEEPRSDNADFSGRWTVTFADDAGGILTGVAEFGQSCHVITGKVRTAAWEQVPLVGDANDEELRLSLFDGQQAVLYEGRLNKRGELVGECWSTGSGHARFTAIRNPDATL